jgi:hypothetical protein
MAPSNVMRGALTTSRRGGSEECGVADGGARKVACGVYKLPGEQAAGREVRAMPSEE